MGIETSHPISAMNEQAFHKLDYEVMRHAFSLHNSLGNLWDEEDYKQALKEELLNEEIDTHSEFSVSITHDSFQKNYSAN